VANILSLAVRVTGDASGLQLNPVEKALQRLQQESDKTSKIFEKFAQTSELGAKAQETFDAASSALLQTLRDGNITRDEFVKQFAELEAGARETAAALAEGARVTEANRTAEERYAVELQRLNGLREKGGIDQETYNRAVASARKPLDDAAAAAERAAEAGGKSALKFNELSGVFAVLPGPLGNIAGRISGLSSAGEGLTRIFSGGLSQGVSGLVGSFTSLVNPVTAALAGVAAFAAAANNIAKGLIQLEDRVEKLGNQAFQLGISFEFVQVLEESARRSGTSVDALRTATTKLQTTLVDAGSGGEKAIAAFRGLGLSVEELQAQNPDQQFRSIATAIATIEDPAQRTAAATKLFGEAGVQLLPFFNNLPGAAEDIERFGRAITGLERENIDAFGRALDQLAVAAQGLGQAVLIPFTKTATGVAENFTVLVSSITRTIEALSGVLGPIIDLLGGALNGALGLVAEGFRAIANLTEGVAYVFSFIFPRGTQAAEQTAEAVNKVREATERPLANNIIREIEQASAKTTDLFKRASEDMRTFGNEAGIAYIKLRDRINEARLAFDRSTPEGAEKYRIAIEQANAAYEKQIAIIKKANDERLKTIETERSVIDTLLEQQRIATVFGGDSLRAKAAENFKALSNEIKRLQFELQDVIGLAAEDDLRKKISNLQQLAQRERDIASGRAQESERSYAAERQRVQALQAERERVQKEADKRVATDRQKVNQFVDDQLELARFNGDSRRLQASRNVQAIEEEIARVNKEGGDARARGDKQGFEAALKRVAQLDRKQAEEQIAKQREEYAKQQQAQQQRLAAIQQEYYRREIAQQQEVLRFQAQVQQNAIENQRQLARIRQLATASTQAAQGADIRTEEGARNFIQALQGGFDPQLAVQRQQLKVQQRIAVGLEANLGALGFQTFRFPGVVGA
jgi:hypothetical protein